MFRLMMKDKSRIWWRRIAREALCSKRQVATKLQALSITEAELVLSNERGDTCIPSVEEKLREG